MGTALQKDGAWRAGSFWEASEGSAKVFIQKDQEMKEVEVEKRVQDGSQRFGFEEIKPQTTPDHEGRSGDNPTPEVVDSMEEGEREESQTEETSNLVEEVTSIKNENGELKMKTEAMAAKIGLLEM